MRLRVVLLTTAVLVGVVPAGAASYAPVSVNQLPAALPFSMITGSVPTAQGGTGASTAAGGLINLGGLSKAGDTMGPGALLGITLNGAPTFASLQDMLKQIGAFYAFGGVGNAAAHPLSGTTSFNGANTTGYTLAQWQMLFSGSVDSAGNNPVTALSNEADEVALQAMVNTGGTPYNTETILLPAGYLRFTHPVKSGCYPIDIRGTGRNSTQLFLTVPMTDLWHHGTSDTACPGRYGTHFALSDVTVRASSLENRAFDIVQGLDSKVTFNHVDILGSPYTSGNATTKGSGTFFLNGVRCQSCSNVTFNDSQITGPYGRVGGITGKGLEMTGGGTGSMFWTGGSISGYHQCVLSYTGSAGSSFPTAINGDNEGLYFDGMQSTGCDDVYTSQNNGNGFAGAEYYIFNGQYGTVHRNFLNLNGGGEIFIHHNLVYTDNPFIVAGGTFTAGSKTITGASWLNSAPTVGMVITASYESLPAGTTVTAVSGSSGSATVTMSNQAGNTTGGTVAVSYQPTQAFTATGTSGNATLTSISSLASDASGGMYAQIGGCVYGVPGVSGCDAITAIDGYNMTVTVATAPNASGTVNGSFHYPETAPNLYNVNNGSDVHIDQQDIQMPPGARMGAMLGVANSYNVHISGWDINDLGNVTTAAFYDQGGNKNLIEDGTATVGPGWNNSGASVLVFNALGSNSTTVRWGSYYKMLGCDLGTSGKVTCSGSTVGTLNSSLTATFTMPNAFLNAPTVTAVNGDANLNSFCATLGSTTTTSFSAKCPAAASGQNARINWTAVGY